MCYVEQHPRKGRLREASCKKSEFIKLFVSTSSIVMPILHLHYILQAYLFWLVIFVDCLGSHDSISVCYGNFV